MARYAQLQIYYLGESFGHNQRITFTIGGVPLTLTALEVPVSGGNFFYQDPTTTYGYGMGAGNAVAFAAAIQTALAAIGRTDFDVQATFTPMNPAGGGLASTTITIKARQFGAGYNFVLPTLDPPQPYLFLDTWDNRDPPTLTPTVTIARCFASATGSIAVAVAGGVGPYTYLWDDGTTTADRMLLPAGTYTLTVTDAAVAGPTPDQFVIPGVRTISIVVGQNPRLDVLVTKNDGDVALAVSGGTPGYAYRWSDGATTAARTGLAGGTYVCTITDAQGCYTQVSVTVESSRFYFAGNPITLALDAGPAYRLDPTTKPNLSFVCAVHVEVDYGSGTFVPLGTLLEQPADRDGRTLFEVQALLAPFLDYHVPAPGQTGIALATPLFRRFYLQYYEQSGATPAPSAVITQARHYVVLGGLDFYESRSNTWFGQYQAAVKPFFTWEPNDKLVAADQPEFLYFMATGVFSFRRYQVFYDDGTAGPVQTQGTIGGQRYELYCWAVGFAALGLADEPTRRVVSWTVWLDSGAGPQTEVRRFVLDRRPVPQRRYLLFATSLGSMATWAVTGEAQFEAEVTGDQAEYPLPPGYDPQRGDVVVQERSLRPVLKVASGLRSRAQLAGAQDLLLSRRVLLLHEGRWLPGYFKPKTVRLADDGNDLPTLELEFYLPRQQFFTPHLPLVAAGLPVPAATISLP
jgi:hypothetical protein